jgi:glycosyltransferase involved in cell wall biosynthesis
VDSIRLIKEDFHLTVIGYGEMEGYLKSEIEKGLGNRVAFIGKLNEAFRYMPNFDALLLPSRFEGLPFTVLEAMLYRLPLIVTPCNGTGDLVSNANGYVAPSIDAGAFAIAIRKFINDYVNNKEFIGKLVAENYDLVETEYSLDAVKQKIKKLYL